MILLSLVKIRTGEKTVRIFIADNCCEISFTLLL